MPSSTNRTGEVFTTSTFVESIRASSASAKAWALWGSDTTGPTFAGIATLSSGVGSLTATWLPATADRTAQANIVYQLCWSTSGATACTGANFPNAYGVPSNPLMVTAPGATSAVITGLLSSNI